MPSHSIHGQTANDLRVHRDAQRAAKTAFGSASAMRVSRVCMAAVWAAGDLSGSSWQLQRLQGQYVSAWRASEASCEQRARAAERVRQHM